MESNLSSSNAATNAMPNMEVMHQQMAMYQQQQQQYIQQLVRKENPLSLLVRSVGRSLIRLFCRW